MSFSKQEDKISLLTSSGITKPGPTQAWALASELGEKENSSLQFMVPAMVTRFN